MASLADQVKLKADISPDCDWIKSNFDGRATSRAQEMDGLSSAKASLAGAASLLQVQTPEVSKKLGGADKLANIRFLGMH